VAHEGNTDGNSLSESVGVHQKGEGTRRKDGGSGSGTRRHTGMKMWNSVVYSGGCKPVDISGMQHMCTLVVETEDEDRGRGKFLEGLVKAIKGFGFYSAGKEEF